ncbi:MAG TPA: adenylyltransferase/cytidyltransferase family protein [Candidatus Saccharimonadales bacterium]|nr:adenylyltransferase/cytidyltransferase family protein [Candidatus Saccharimonadales bacterium]
MSQQTVTGKKPAGNRGVFGPGSNYEERFIPDYTRLAELVNACKTVGLKIVLTMGTFDFIHIGHFLYLEKAKGYGDLLIVGVDSDEKVKARKGPERPIVAEEERVKMLTHVRHVDVVTLKEQQHGKWELIKLVQPDILIATAETYSPTQLEELKQYCGQVVVMPKQATTSSTAKLRRLNIGLANKMKKAVAEAVEDAFDKLSQGA